MLIPAMASWKWPRAYSRVSVMPEPGRMSWKWLNRICLQESRKIPVRVGDPVIEVAAAARASASEARSSAMRFAILIRLWEV